jgi:ribonuclease HI
METAWEAENDKDECIVNLEGPQRNYWLGSEAGMLGCYWFSGVVFAGDGSPADHKGRMGAGAYCLGDLDVQQCVGVGREEEGTSSNRPELAALVLALRKTRFTDNLLYLCDNQLLLKAVQKWTGEGPKQTTANAPDADILREIMELLKMRVQNRAATFWVKVKAHRGEPLNELEDSLAEAAREVSMEKKEWFNRTERMVFKWKDKDQERSSIWTAGVRNAIRKGVGRSVVKQVKSKVADKWRRAHLERGEGCDRHKRRTQTWMRPT